MSAAEPCATHKCPDCAAERIDGQATTRHAVGQGEALPRRELERVTTEWLDRGIIA